MHFHVTRKAIEYNINITNTITPNQGNNMTQLEQTAAKHNLTPEQAMQLKSAIQQTWEYVGYDFMECCGGEDEALNIFDSYAQMVAEATVDAGRLRDQGDVEWFYNLEGDLLKIAEDIYTARSW